MNIDRSKPKESQFANQNLMLTENQNLIDFLHTLKLHGLLEDGTDSGLVLYADDQAVLREQMKAHFFDMGIQEKLIMFNDGK